MPLDVESARRFYDRIGRTQDTQRFYEDPATRRLTSLAGLASARSVFELGYGTGRYAATLLADELSDDARYLGVEVSPVMMRVARERLAGWEPRAQVLLVEPPARNLPGADGSFDRFLATYVFDLLSPDDARGLIGEAHRLLEPGGLLGLVSLTHGPAGISKLVSAAWREVGTRWPGLVGGCRPIELGELLDGRRWRVADREIITSWGVPSEVLVAARADD